MEEGQKGWTNVWWWRVACKKGDREEKSNLMWWNWLHARRRPQGGGRGAGQMFVGAKIVSRISVRGGRGGEEW